MLTKVRYTAVLRDVKAGYTAHHITLSSGITRARKEMENSLGHDLELAALIQGNMPVSIPKETR